MRKNSVDKINSNNLIFTLVINSLMNETTTKSLNNYHYVKIVDNNWQREIFDSLCEIHILEYFTDISLLYYEQSNKYPVKYKAEIIPYIILKDTINYLVNEISNVLDSNTIKIESLIPQYLIEETSDKLVVYRQNNSDDQ